ncbi:hypothetical protein [Brevibacillus sp. HD3.3A]|uniref:hypothetical protein n=1 Tax=Brevibacillus sp. HD3.3A TaxID=2738979 RepID=UPI00156B8FFC|nr:hypothetical protein [Brevibacillus sp. HD3.3A]UED70695.1 hypothetical protein HP435_08690 [Brevibacillus sp. HD3.3A]
MEITLSTGKKVTLREKKGQHNFIERKLQALTFGDSGANLGSVLATVTISTIVAIETVNGQAVDIPKNEAEVFELMDNFTYDEWNELEGKTAPKAVREKLEEAAKNSQKPPGSVTV